MFITMQNNIININEIRNISASPESKIILIYFRMSHGVSDYIRIDCKTEEQFQEELDKIKKACVAYGKN